MEDAKNKLDTTHKFSLLATVISVTVTVKTKMSSTILVVGGAGYVGSHVVLQLLQKDWNVAVLDNVDDCYCRKPETLRKVQHITGKKIKYYQCSIRDEGNLDSVFNCEKIDCIIHLATLNNSAKNSLKFYQNDVCGTVCLLEAMKRYKVNKIVFSSTVSVYTSPDVLPITEAHETGYQLPNVFSRSKLMVEEILKDLCTSDSTLTAIVLRHVSPAGAHESGALGKKRKKSDVVSIARHLLLGQDKICICREEYEGFYEVGMRDYLHVSDVAAAYVLAANKALSSFKGFGVYNLASRRPHTIVDLLDKMSVVSGELLMYEVLEEGRAEAAFYVSGELARKELGWKAKKSLRDICRDTINWINANPSVFESDSFIE